MTRKAAPRARVPLRGSDAARGTPVELTTPEGVPLVFRAAPMGDRVAALLIDVLLLIALLVGVALLLLLAQGGELVGSWAETAFLLVAFVIRYGWFTVFELRGRGSTPGKARVGIRVVDASGGPLRADAVLVRNLAREVEVFLPLSVLLVPGLGGGEAGAGVRVVAFAWTFGFGLVPWLNRRHLRLGDLVAGTMVVVVPRATLLDDVGRSAPGPDAGRDGVPAPAPESAAVAEGPRFTPAQLDVYGVYELQVLEDVLRPTADPKARRETLGAVAARIAGKIGWPSPVPDGGAEAFLKAYYAALRAHLERRMLLGRPKADKHAR